jgi:hypothetical protein
MAILIALTAISIAAIAGWATVASVQMIASGRRRGGDQEVLRRVDDLTDVVAELRADLDEVTTKHDGDMVTLEERLDFAERLLTRAREESKP